RQRRVVEREEPPRSEPATHCRERLPRVQVPGDVLSLERVHAHEVVDGAVALDERPAVRDVNALVGKREAEEATGGLLDARVDLHNGEAHAGRGELAHQLPGTEPDEEPGRMWRGRWVESRERADELEVRMVPATRLQR